MHFTRLVIAAFWLFLIGACSNETPQNEADDGTTELMEEEIETKGPTLEYVGNADYKRYTVESGILEMELSGLQNGKQMLYFDNWGMREAKYLDSKLKIGDTERPTKKVELIVGERSYNIDLLTNTGMVGKNRSWDQAKANSGVSDPDLFTHNYMEGLGGVKAGEEEIAGKPCIIWEFPDQNTTVSVWNNIPLKFEFKAEDRFQLALTTSIETDVTIPEDKFKLPANVAFTEMQ